jgi:hypothetical protein
MPYHCSMLTECANGDLLSLWYGGSYEADDDQKLWLAGRKKGERTWGKLSLRSSSGKTARCSS